MGNRCLGKGKSRNEIQLEYQNASKKSQINNSKSIQNSSTIYLFYVYQRFNISNNFTN